MSDDNMLIGSSRLVISPADRDLLVKVYQFDDPRRLPALRDQIPDLTETPVDEVEGVYYVQAGRAERHKWICCCECRRDNNHTRGFVLRFTDGSRATVGRDCGRQDHSLDFDENIKTFEGKRGRARRLRQLIAAMRSTPEVIGCLRALGKDPAYLAAQNLLYQLRTKLPDLFGRLEAAPNGAIEAPVKKRDHDAERRRDERLERKLEAAARRRGLDRDAIGVDQALRAEMERSGDADASKEAIMTTQRAVIARYAGAGFISDFHRLRLDASHVEESLSDLLSSVSGKHTAELSDAKLDSIRRRFTKAIDDGIAVCRRFEAALTFATFENLAVIVRAANRFRSKEGLGKLAIVDCHVVRDAPSRVAVCFALPAAMVSSFALEKMKQRIEDAGIGEQETFNEQRSAA